MVALAGAWACPSARADVVQERVVIGRSPSGMPITVHRFADPEADALSRDADSRPALAVIAGLDARHAVGRDVAERVGRLIADRHAGVLAGRTLYVIPVVNPDGFAMLNEPGRARAEFGRSPRAMDADRDRRVGEDPGDDLNGDGMVTRMRVLRPGPGTGSGAGPRATMMVDPDDPRAMRAPRTAEGEVATHAVLIEGRDDDGDGSFNEDGYAGSAGGGVMLDRNFPTFWAEHAEDAGQYPASEPEVRAVMEWLLSRPNIQMVLVYGPGDTLLNPPRAGQYDATRRVPTGLEPGDEDLFKRLAKAYKETIGDITAPAPDPAGSLTSWAYADLGVWSLRSAVWGRPGTVAKPAAAEAEGAGEGAGERPAGAEAAGRALGKNASEEAKALAFIDSTWGPSGFVAWAPFEHPQLGLVEIGGPAAGAMFNPPAAELDGLAERHAEFVAGLLDRLADLRLGAPVVEPVGAGLYRVTLSLSNPGELPTVNAIGLKAGRVPPEVFIIGVPPERVVTGPRVQRVGVVPGRGAENVEWLVRAQPGERVEIEVRSARFGRRIIPVTLGTR